MSYSGSHGPPAQDPCDCACGTQLRQAPQTAHASCGQSKTQMHATVSPLGTTCTDVHAVGWYQPAASDISTYQEFMKSDKDQFCACYELNSRHAGFETPSLQPVTHVQVITCSYLRALPNKPQPVLPHDTLCITFHTHAYNGQHPALH